MINDNENIGINIEHPYSCSCCNYFTSRKSNYEKHLTTLKHKINSKETINKEYNCEICNINFNNKNSLWKHTTRKHPPIKDEYKLNKLTNLMVHVVEQNTYLSQQICQIAKDSNNAHINSHNTTTTNNRFNINFYLNETCGNAMNINEFIDSIQVGIEDLEETSRLGFVDGISRIIINNLNKMERPDRPIHCSDSKRMTFYIRNEDTWNKDENNDNDKIKSMIKTVAGKNMIQIYEWQKQNPEYSDPYSKCSDTYQKMLFQVMNGNTVEESNDNINKIIKNIAKETIIIKKPLVL